MKSITISLHPLAIAAIVAVGLPSIAVAAGTILSPPVTITDNSSGSSLSSTNSGAGAAIQGLSLAGKGVIGQTKFNSTNRNNREAGVVGQDLSKTGTFNSGVRGSSNVGSGVSGTSSVGNGIVGDTSFESTSEDNKTAGVFGKDLSVGAGTFNAGVLGTSTIGDAGVYGIGTTAFGVYGTEAYPSGSGFGGLGGVFGQDLSTDGGHGDFGTAGHSDLGTGVLGASLSFVSVEGAPPFSRYWVNDGNGGYLQTGVIGAGLFGVAAFGLGDTNSNDPALYIQSFNGAVLIRARGTGGEEMSLDNSGNMILHGTLQQHGNPLSEHRNALGHSVDAYGIVSATASIEDFGSAELSEGIAHVQLDPKFAELIDPHTAYLVFVTPQGPSRGLYITSKTIRGFDVRENPDGRSTVAFDYRIVAKPLDSDGRSLPAVLPPRTKPSGSFVINRRSGRPRP